MRRHLRAILKMVLPADTYRKLFEAYHLSLAYIGAYLNGFPSKKLFVIAVTGTKGKSTTVEIVRALLMEAGYTTAAASTIRFCIGQECEPNLYKMTMVGRFFLQKFLRRALDAGATHAIIEMTSEGAVQFRHKAIDLDALIFTNLAPEHLESHGGMEAYARAKLSLAEHLAESPKRPRYLIANADDVYGERFLATDVEERIPFMLKEAEPYTADDRGVRFTWRGELFTSPLPGVFNLKNILAALALGEALGIPRSTMKRAIEKMKPVAGRAERIERGQDFTVIVDYAHTPDSLTALYGAFGGVTKALREEGGAYPRRICVLGSTGGGRDTWKRPAMGKIADEFCDLAFLTDEDPYDEAPKKIVEEIARGFTQSEPRIMLDRRKAIRAALKEARKGDMVLISGKGTDPYIMRESGTKEPWSDREVAEEELDRLLKTKKRAAK